MRFLFHYTSILLKVFWFRCPFIFKFEVAMWALCPILSYSTFLVILLISLSMSVFEELILVSQLKFLPPSLPNVSHIQISQSFLLMCVLPSGIPFSSLWFVSVKKAISVFVTVSPPFSFTSRLIFSQFVSDWATPSKTKWSILMEDIFGKETSNGVTVVRFPWNNSESSILGEDRVSLS